MPLYDTSLWKLLKESQSDTVSIMDTLSRLQMLECIARTLAYLQDGNLCHLDVKPSNVLVNLAGSNWNGDLVWVRIVENLTVHGRGAYRKP